VFGYSSLPAARVVAPAVLLACGLAPASAATIRVPAGGDLQRALDAARDGDTIVLEPGATYVGNFRLPVHGGTTYVTVRSGADERLLPGPGTRISPAHAAALPKLKSPNTSPALATAPGAAFWRLQWLELQATRQGYFDIVTLGDGSRAQTSLAEVPHDLVLDRVYVHGDPLHGQKRGIALNSGQTTIRNSYIAEIKGIGQDSLAIGGWNGPGPYLIENNHLEAAGEVLMFGGADPAIANLVPADIVIRGNTLTRPLGWRDAIVPAPAGVRGTAAPGGRLPAGTYAYRVVARRPAYDTTATSVASAEVRVPVSEGGRVTLTWPAVPDATEYRVYGRTPDAPAGFWTVTGTTWTDDGRSDAAAGRPPSAATKWQVKNLLELKNARRVLIEHNVLEHNWAQAQNGTAIVLTPRNQSGNCRWCVIEDIAFEYNLVRGVGAGVVILGRDNDRPSQQARNIRVRHNLFTDLSRTWGGSGYFLVLLGEPRDVVIDHNTIISPDGAGVVAVEGPPIHGFVFTNNIARHNRYGILGADYGIGLPAIRHYFPDGVVTRNVLAGGDERSYPRPNEFPTVAQFEAQFADYAGGHFALKPGSEWVRAATDGEGLGADTRKLGSIASDAGPAATPLR
jgi:hypothetical protein